MKLGNLGFNLRRLPPRITDLEGYCPVKIQDTPGIVTGAELIV